MATRTQDPADLMCLADPESLRAEFAAWVEARLTEGPYWYLYGGSESLEKGVDCSGVICVGARAISVPLPLGRPNTDVLWTKLERIPVAKAGDLALYGSGSVLDPACHVMIVLAGGRVAGMSGGTSKTTTREIAIAKNARLQEHPDHLYRKDFIGFRRLPFHLAPGLAPGKET